MPNPPRTFPLEIIRNHAIVRIGRAAALLDTGSPLSFRAPALVSEQLGEPIRWLVGTDVLTRDRVLLDWSGRRVVIGGPALSGESLPLVPHAGLFQIEVEGAHGAALAFLDTGAHLSYAPASAVRGLVPVAHERDFYPLFGEFDVPVYALSVRVGRRKIRGRYAVLPELLAMLLAGVGGTGWILGSDFFRDRAIQLDLANNRVIDTTVVAPRQRTTSRYALGQNAENGEGPALETADSTTNEGIEGWRGWRLTDVGGSPHLQSITAGDLWDGPCFTSNELPVVTSIRRHTGIHAYVTPGQMQSVLRGPALVYGQLTLHGQVCVHETGYRAEHARIDRLFLRACGKHAPSNAPLTGVLLLDAENYEPGSYCACDSLAPHEWLSYEQLDTLAGQLGDRYQCDVIIDAERARAPTYACAQRRRSRNIHARSA